MKQMKEYQRNTLLKSVSTLNKWSASELFGSSSQTSLGDDSLGSFWPSGFHLKGEYETGKGHSRITAASHFYPDNWIDFKSKKTILK